MELELDNENEPISVAAATAADISKTLAKTENETRITRINKKIEEIKKLDEMIQKKPGTKNKNIPLRDQHLIITEDLINKLDNPVPQSIQRWKNENNEKIERAHTAEKLRRKKRIEKRRRERGTPPPRRTRSHRLTKKSHIGGRKKKYSRGKLADKRLRALEKSLLNRGRKTKKKIKKKGKTRKSR